MGDLSVAFEEQVQPAVNRSLQESKPLVVYCSSDDDIWLKTWLNNDIGKLLQTRCVAVRLLQNTPDFNYFEQICPNVPVPSFCCILEGKIAAIIQGENYSENRTTLLTCLGLPNPGPSQEVHGDSGEGSFRQRDTSLREEAEKKVAQMYHESVLKQRKVEKEERERIIRLVKADREEFVAKRRGSVKPEAQVPVSNLDSIHDNIKSAERLLAKTCTLQIRLLNGHSITHQFDSSTKLDAVRQWVDANRTDGDMPYVFLRSIPRETFLDSDEMKSLRDLQLTPRSVLIVKAIETGLNRPRVVDAQGPGLLGKMFNSVSGWWNSGKSDEHESTGRPSSKSSVRQMDDSISVASSKYVSPLNSPRMKHQLMRNPSELSLPSRPVSPNVYQFVNADDENRDETDRKTFNGNSVKLEDKNDGSDESN
ncbi:LADA_0H12750g1_1 [Lachancea dasiensis]|uniref:LADA_0H12750g1_1 n=1 Tax=Lachancea dasiensis TaxID=1072105 RepID=A0A1G4K3X1_9SACH|nr:LADA_0H12750g1_1 [Lachancea dasiensis]